MIYSLATSFPNGASEFDMNTIISAVKLCNSSSLISVGSSTNVYCVDIDGTPSVIKKLYPVGLIEQKIIIESNIDTNSRVVVKKTPKSILLWHKARRRFINAYKLNYYFQKNELLTDYIVPVHLYIKNKGTIYSISIMKPGIPLNRIRNISPEVLMRLIIQIAEMSEIIHQLGWLLIDIKAANFIVYDLYRSPSVRLTDFDSAIKISQVKSISKCMCSNETAAPETINCNKKDIGPHSDVFSIAAMLFIILSKRPIANNLEMLYKERIEPYLSAWKNESVWKLKETLLSALDPCPKTRTKSCKDFVCGLRAICEMEGIQL